MNCARTHDQEDDLPIPENAKPSDYITAHVHRTTMKTHPMTIHDLFNELHRRLVIEAHEADLAKSFRLTKVHNKVDELHHDYTDLTS